MSYASKLLARGEEIVLEARPHWFLVIGRSWWAIILAILALAVLMFVAGPPKNGVQFMVKDSKKYASTGGWGFAHFDNSKPASEAVHKTCFSCHEPAARDFVFTRYAP